MGRKKKRMEQEKEKLPLGTIYQVKKGGNYYLRYQINGKRKNVNLKTDDYEKALEEYNRLLPTLQATTVEIVAAHVKNARQLAGRIMRLTLGSAWEKYSVSPDRAMPATIHEQMSYQSTFQDFVDFIGDPLRELHTITYEDALGFTKHMKTLNIAVDTHNRRVLRLRKIFNVLKEYCNDAENPFASRTLLRKPREEQDIGVRRMSFTHEQEKALMEALENPKFKVKNKQEIKVIYYLGLYTGQRLKDCVLLRWSKVNLAQRKIECKQFKTGKDVTIPIAPQLLTVLNEALAWKTDDYGYVCPNVAERYNKVDAKGKNIGNGLVNIDVLRVLKWIGLKTSVNVEGRARAITVYGFHSLRHSFASHCAEANVPKAVVQSILGDNCDIIDAYYTHIGDEAQQKAIAVIAGEVGVITPQEKINRTLKYIDTLPDTPEYKKIRELLSSETK
ncbi:MAG: tyrosine-type recombinase/integrase [Victivallales bacterium]|nr:tyrosine-type recombinase/integrase [Victivallales bacterium]